MARTRRWPTLNQMRDAYAASGLELAKRHPLCRGKVRHGSLDDADRHIATLLAKPDEHARRADRLGKYACRWCGGWHVGHYAAGTRRRGKRARRGPTTTH